MSEHGNGKISVAVFDADKGEMIDVIEMPAVPRMGEYVRENWFVEDGDDLFQVFRIDHAPPDSFIEEPHVVLHVIRRSVVDVCSENLDAIEVARTMHKVDKTIGLGIIPPTTPPNPRDLDTSERN